MTRIVLFLTVFFTSLTDIFSAPPKTDEFPFPGQQYSSIPPYFPGPSYYLLPHNFLSSTIVPRNETETSPRIVASPTNASALSPIASAPKPLPLFIPLLPVIPPYLPALPNLPGSQHFPSAASLRTAPSLRTVSSLGTTTPQKEAESRKTKLSTKTTASLSTRPSTKSTAFLSTRSSSNPTPALRTSSFSTTTTSSRTRSPTKITASPRTRPSTKITASMGMIRNWRNLEKFVKALEADCNFHLLDEVYKDLKNLWARAMKGRSDRNQSEMDYLQRFLKNLLEQYSKCAEKWLILDSDRQWEIYGKIFGKEYSEKEKAIRKAIFERNVENIIEHNELYEHGLTTYTTSLNHFSDWTKEELNELNGLRISANASSLHGRQKRMDDFFKGAARMAYDYNPNDALPDSYVWGTDYVTPVRNQGKCGACYAIAGNGALEAYHKKQTGELVELSVQNILDCTWHLGNRGCGGGEAFSVFDYARTDGVVPDSWYPYTMNASRNCRWELEHATAKDKGYYTIPEGNENALQHAVAKHGPVAVGIGTKGIQGYRSGVFHTSDCGPASHAVLVVGYGTALWGGDYWIVKNCWGYNWGDEGYVRIARNRNNMCYIASYAYLPY